jgi:hypothetical protein
MLGGLPMDDVMYIYTSRLHMAKRRKQVYIEEYQEAMLKRLAKKRGQPEAVLIREALDGFAGSVQDTGPGDLTAWKAESIYIRERMQSRRPARGNRKWKREELYDRWKKSG